jgi:formiminotetrahydrofolate cyclodeaminase
LPTESVNDWLSQLASAQPAPGGGAAAALHAAMAAGLVEMVCNLTIGKPKYVEHEMLVFEVRDHAATLRRQAVDLADADARAFTAVTEAYKLPKDTDQAKQTRTAAIQAALVEAADVPVHTAEVASRVLELAERIIGKSNINVMSDIAVSASSAGAALESAAVNVAVNRSAITAPEVAERLGDAISRIDHDIQTARQIVADIRERIST